MMYSCFILYPVGLSRLLAIDNGNSNSTLNSWFGFSVILEVMSHGMLL